MLFESQVGGWGLLGGCWVAWAGLEDSGALVVFLGDWGRAGGFWGSGGLLGGLFGFGGGVGAILTGLWAWAGLAVVLGFIVAIWFFLVFWAFSWCLWFQFFVVFLILNDFCNFFNFN